LIPRKNIKIVATRYQFLRPKCTNIAFGWGSAPDPAGRAYSVPPGPLAVFKRPTSKGREGKGRGGKEGRGKEEMDSSPPPPMRNPGYATGWSPLCGSGQSQVGGPVWATK